MVRCCSDCGTDITIRGVRSFRCEVCQQSSKNLKAVEYRRENKNSISERGKKSWRKTQYGLSEERFQMLKLAQFDRCGICRKEFDESQHGAQIDHDHKTGVIRGLLCVKCNMGLGYFDDSEHSLQSAIEYLQIPTAAMVLVP